MNNRMLRSTLGRPVLARAMLVAFGLTVGVILALGLFQLNRMLRPEPRRITAADYSELRRQLDENPKAVFQFDEDISYRMKPHFRGVRYGTEDLPHVTNSLGVLGEAEIDPDPAVRKILFLGDSVAYGYGLPEEACFVSRMQAAAGSRWQLVNAGCPGWSTFQQIGFYNKFLRDVDWDLVVVVVCLNDILKFEWVYKQGAGFEMSGEIELFGEIALLTARTVEEIRLGALRTTFAAGQQTAPLARHHNGFLTNWEETRWPAYLNDVLGPFLSDGSRHPVLITVVPTPFQLEAHRLGAADDVVFFPQAKLLGFCRENDVPTWDGATPLAATREASGNRQFLDNCHLSAAGHETVAKSLWPQVRKLIDDSPANRLVRQPANVSPR